MTVNAAIEAELPFLRREAEARMTSRATIYRKTDRTAQDESTGYDAPVWDVLGVLPFRLDTGGDSNGGSRGVTVGGVTYEEASGVGHIPTDADARLTSPLADGDLADVTGETAGVWRVIAAVAYDQKTARRLPIAEEQRPEEWG